MLLKTSKKIDFYRAFPSTPHLKNTCRLRAISELLYLPWSFNAHFYAIYSLKKHLRVSQGPFSHPKKHLFVLLLPVPVSPGPVFDDIF